MHPPTPEVRSILRTTQDPTADMRLLRSEIADQDELAERVLQYVRMFYKRMRDLEDSDRALAVLGPRLVGHVLLQQVLIEGVDAMSMPPSLLAQFWSDCCRRALAARAIAELEPEAPADIAFTLGLAAEWGIASSLETSGEFVAWMRDVRTLTGVERLEAERQLFGRSHEHTFVRLARSWELPPEVVRVIGTSHQDKPSVGHGEAAALLRVVRWADKLGEALTSRYASKHLQDWIEEFALHYGKDEATAWRIVDHVLESVPKVARALGVPIAGQPRIQTLRQRGAKTDELDAEQLRELLAVLSEDNELLNVRLRGLEADLEQLQGRDPVTGLLTHRAFVHLLGQELKGARADGRTLSLILIDLDGFGEACSRYGYHAGDEVLRRTGHLLNRLLPGSDGVGRVGADRFGLIVPGDHRKGRLVAERGRAAIEGTTFDIEGKRIRLTASAAGATSADFGGSADSFLHKLEEMVRRNMASGTRNRSSWMGAEDGIVRRPTLSGNRPPLGSR